MIAVGYSDLIVFDLPGDFNLLGHFTGYFFDHLDLLDNVSGELLVRFCKLRPVGQSAFLAINPDCGPNRTVVGALEKDDAGFDGAGSGILPKHVVVQAGTVAAVRTPVAVLANLIFHFLEAIICIENFAAVYDSLASIINAANGGQYLQLIGTPSSEELESVIFWRRRDQGGGSGSGSGIVLAMAKGGPYGQKVCPDLRSPHGASEPEILSESEYDSMEKSSGSLLVLAIFLILLCVNDDGFGSSVNAITLKADQGIPNFRVNDDSRIEITAHEDELRVTMARSNFSEQSTEASVSGSGYGVSVGVSAGFASSTSNTSKSMSSSATRTLVARYMFPRWDLLMWRDEMEPTVELMELIETIRRTKNIKALRRLRAEYWPG
ncbi:hypothetical protein ACJ41O_012254 [Fusarium nematophilum]